MIIQEETPKIINENKSKDFINTNQPVESYLNLQEENPNIDLSQNPKILNPSPENIKKRLSLEILREMLRDQNISIDEKEKINKLIQETREKDYTKSYCDLNGANEDLVQSINQNKESLEKPGLLIFPNNLNYDIEFYKLGRKCHGLKKRYAIIKDGKLYSSDKPLKDLQEKDFEKLKDKTEFLRKADIRKETPESNSGGEWSAKDKDNRIRVDFIPDPKKPEDKSSFFLYFQDERQMKEVDLALYNMSRPPEFKVDAKNTLDNLNKIFLYGKNFYTILKILAVKNRIKKRKANFNRVENIIKGKINVEFNEDFLKTQLLEEKIKISINSSNPVESESAKKKLKAPIPEKEEEIISLPKDININKNLDGLPLSDFMPLVTKATIINEKNSMKKSLNNMINTFNILRNEIPEDIIKESDENNLSTNGICFGIQNGVQVSKNSEGENNFNLQPESCVNSRFILFDKNKPEIIFKEENMIDNENDNLGGNILNEDNIYEISNIIKNSNNDMNEEEENNLIIIGPKINNDIGINYNNKDNPQLYTDPENVNIKSKTINPINNKEIEGVTLQMYHSEININEQKVKDLVINYSGSILEEINYNNLKDNFLFGCTIKLPPLKQIDSPLVSPTQYEQNICFIEYNHQYFIPMEYFTNNSEIIIEIFCIPLISFSKKQDIIPKDQLNYIAKYLSPVVIGYIKISLKDINQRKYQYEILNEDIPLSNSFILINGMVEKIESIKIKNYLEGKDYSIGSDSYIITTMNKEFLEKVKNNRNISDEIKDKYFNVSLDTNDEEQILLRPDENIDENEFIRDISTQINDEDLLKIKNNKKYNYLPHCEKYIDKETLFKSKNLSCLSEEQKEYISNQYQPNEWIYKLPEFKVKLLSKNLGVVKNDNNVNVSQKIYCTSEEFLYPLDSLNEYSEERIIPLSENNFNTFDFKEKEFFDTNNMNNFQWKTSIKFNNALQMNSFIKLLNLARQNINMKKKGNKDIIAFEEKKIEEIDNKNNLNLDDKDNPSDFDINLSGNKKLNKCDVYIEYIEFIPDFNLEEENSELETKLSIEGIKEKTIIKYFIDDKYGFQNSLTKSKLFQQKQNQYKNIGEDKEMKIVPLNKKIILDKKKFNDGEKKIYFEDENPAEINFNKELDNNITYKLLVSLGKNEFSTPLEINKYLSDTNFKKLEIPIYKEDDKDKIYALVLIYLFEKGENIASIREKYEESYQKYLKEPLLLFKENNFIEMPSKNNKFGLYEPNVYRRRILNSIHKNIDINIDPVNLNNYGEDELIKLYQILQNKCAILPPMSNFPYFKISNLRRNNDIYDLNNSYRRQLGLMLLENQRHENFMKIYRKNRWDLYLKDLSKGKEGIKPIDFFTGIPDKVYLLKNRERMDKLNNLMYLGVAPEYREQVYSLLLDLPKLHQETRNKIFEEYKKDLKFPQQIYSFFANKLFDDNPKRNIIFSLIDNDSNFLSSLENSSLEEINKVKKIAKAFFIWSELKIGLEDKNDKYVYFVGLLTLTQQLLQNFEKEYFTFWALIGLAKNITHFHQKNPLFSDELNYINICGLVTKLIMESNQKKIFDKFISLNIPPELFITRHLSTLFTDYFKGELMMRILDIIVFELSIQNFYNNDNMQYLRILCAIPLTLFEFSQSDILACKSVSEIQSITNDLFLHTFRRNKFISKLQENLNKFYVVSNFFEKWFFSNKSRQWDSKRGDLENLIKRHFFPVYEENKNYLLEIKDKLKNASQEIIDLVFDNLDNKLISMKSLYSQGTTDFDDSNSFMGICVQIAKLKQIYNNENCDINEYILVVSFGDTADKTELAKYEHGEFNINFDSQNNEILNLQDLFYKNEFKNSQSPKYIIFSLLDKNNQNRANFSYKILNYEPMKISKISLENKEETNKFFLEFVLFKYNTKLISADDLALFNNIFSIPEYYNSKRIEEKFYNFDISGFYFNREISKLIEEENKNRNSIINGSSFDTNMKEMFRRFNNNEINEDSYNFKRIINKKNDMFNDLISQRILKIIETSIQGDVSNVVKKWLGDTNISFEEILYSIILVDKSIISVNEKLFLLFSIAQMRDRLLLNTDNISIEKLKEMIYSLYKRFRIYFTKSDIERMVDFLLKDERLFNIKYAFVHNKKDSEKINEIINDKDYYEPKNEKNIKIFEKLFDDIAKELNIFLNHLNNHYNINSFSANIISYIFSQILNKKDIKAFSKNNFDTLTLLYEKDDIIYKRIYSIKYSPLSITEEKNDINIINDKYSNEAINKVLIHEMSNISINNSYNVTNLISFDKFKEVFFKLPYLSDLFRVCFSYLSEDKNVTNVKELSSFKVIVGYEDFTTGTFYFPNKAESDEEIEEQNEKMIKYDMGYRVKLSDTVDEIITKIIDKLSKNRIKIKNDEQAIIDYLKSIYKIKCTIWYDIDGYNSGKIMQENIGYFDTLYSCINLKNKDRAEIHIMFNNDLMSFNSERQPVQKENGYCKIYLSNNDDFIWKKCKVKRKNMDKVKLMSCDYKSIPRILNKNEDVVLAYDI